MAGQVIGKVGARPVAMIGLTIAALGIAVPAIWEGAAMVVIGTSFAPAGSVPRSSRRRPPRSRRSTIRGRAGVRDPQHLPRVRCGARCGGGVEYRGGEPRRNRRSGSAAGSPSPRSPRPSPPSSRWSSPPASRRSSRPPRPLTHAWRPKNRCDLRAGSSDGRRPHPNIGIAAPARVR